MEGDIGHGLKWSAISIVAVRALSAIRSLTIARVVGPESFGSFAAAFAFVAFAALITEFGLQSYLIQRGSRARADAFAVGQLTLAIGGACSVLLILAAGPIANLYGDGEISRLVVAMSASVILTALTVVPTALLRADMRFDVVGRAAVCAEFAACVVGIGAAANGAGVWALVAATVTSQVVTLAVLVVARPAWDRPNRADRVEGRRRALRFGASVATGSAVWTFALHGDNVVVGRALGASALGLYAFAYNYGILPGGIVGSTVTDVALAGFSGAPSDEQRVSLLSQFVRVGAAAATPLVLLSLALVPAGIRLVLGDDWLGATTPLQILLIVGWLRGVLPAEALLRSKGRVGVELKVGLVAAPLTVLAAIVGTTISLTAVALGVGGVLIAGSIAATWIATRSIGTNMTTVTRAAAPSILVGIACALPVSANEIFRLTPDAIALFIGGPISLAAAVLATRRFLPVEWQSLSDIASARRSAV
ncbi:MAG: oligosaccharide flippase family protein [Acidimicrobiales bacterium]|nr:oligosaccharide flippase family protein [Acidimicrobiales bacterium]